MIKKKQRIVKWQRVRDTVTRKKYSGEGSPYWDFVNQRQAHQEADHLTESDLANPDMLPEIERDADEEHAAKLRARLRLTVLREVMLEATPRQQEIIACLREHTEEEAAQKLGIARWTVRTTMESIAVRVVDLYNKRVARLRLKK
jgi:DNA-binding CsgD family transcriptional regulator